MKQKLVWRVGYCNTPDSRPNEYFPAAVPGAVQLDYAKEYDLPPHTFETCYEEYKWMEDKFWVYSTEIDATNKQNGRLFFVSKGIDFKYDIYVNGENRFSYEGMYREARVDLTDLLGSTAKLEVVVYPAPKSNLEGVIPNTRDEANQTTKPAVSYGWDFHPRLIPLGIWGETYLEHTSQPVAVKPQVTYSLNSDRTHAVVNLSVDAEEVVGWSFFAPNGEVVFEGKNAFESFDIEDPLLWWCNGYGDPNLYSYELRVKCFDSQELYCGKVGFRTVSLEMNEGTWSVPEFPKTRSMPPITLCLNGVNVFVKGSNWVAPEIFYSSITYQRYSELLHLVKDANLNFLRCWGGAAVGHEAFYELCDELGIMVWQEFPLGCNNYVATDYYLSLLKNEATDIIDRVAKHPCHVIWCGGNELFNAWSGMTDQSLALRTLNSLTLENTPNIPFLPTSPLMGMAHGSYLFIYFEGEEVIEVMQNCHNTAYTEFGVAAISNPECLSEITDPEKLFPLVKNDITVAHHAFNAWCREDTWCGIDTIEHYFGQSESLEELIKRSQYLQGVGYRFIFEEARRQKPYCSMAVNWCFDEPWPCIANNSVICYPNHVKAAYYEIAAACRGVAASARYRKLMHTAGETLEFDLWMLNDGIESVGATTVKCFVQVGDTEPAFVMDWCVPNLTANVNFQGPTVRYILPEVENAGTLKIILSCGKYSSEYTLLYNAPATGTGKVKMLNI